MTDRVSIAGSRLEVARIAGVASTPTLVFLHEGLGSVSAWRDFPERVARTTGLPGLVYSRAGYGQSDPVELPRPLSYMQDEAHRDLPALLDAEGIADAVLVGHSDGASIALVYAATDHGRARVRGLVLEAPHVFREQRSVDAIARAREAYEHGELRDRLAKHHADVDVAFWGWNRAWLDPQFREWNIEAYLPRVHAPSLLIQSDDDPYGTLAQLDAIEKGAGRGAATASGGRVERLVLPRCGHTPHRDRPDETLDAVARFVGKLAPQHIADSSS